MEKRSSFSSEPISDLNSELRHSGFVSEGGILGGKSAPCGALDHGGVSPSLSILDHGPLIDRPIQKNTLSFDRSVDVRLRKRKSRVFFALASGVKRYASLSDRFGYVKKNQVRFLNGLKFVSFTSDLSHSFVDAVGLERERVKLLRDFKVWYWRILRYHRGLYGPAWKLPYSCGIVQFNKTKNLLHLHITFAAGPEVLDYATCQEVWSEVHSPIMKIQDFYVPADCSDLAKAAWRPARYVCRYVSQQNAHKRMLEGGGWVFKGYMKEWKSVKKQFKIVEKILPVASRPIYRLNRENLDRAIGFWNGLMRSPVLTASPDPDAWFKRACRSYGKLSDLSDPLLPDVSKDFALALNNGGSRWVKRRVAPWHGHYRGP